MSEERSITKDIFMRNDISEFLKNGPRISSVPGTSTVQAVNSRRNNYVENRNSYA